jgi:hypothetical protein
VLRLIRAGLEASAQEGDGSELELLLSDQNRGSCLCLPCEFLRFCAIVYLSSLENPFHCSLQTEILP